MQAFTHYSRHALRRLAERTHLTAETMAELLDAGAFVHIGNTPGFNREHLLVYSLPDNAAYAAIRDSLTGTLVTILPLDYQDRVWKVTQDMIDQARQLAHQHDSAVKSSALRETSKSFYVSAHYLDDTGAPKSRLIRKEPVEAHGKDASRYIAGLTLADIEALCQKKDVPFARTSYLGVRLGNHGKPLLVELQDWQALIGE